MLALGWVTTMEYFLPLTQCLTREHTVPNKGAYGAVKSLGNIQCCTFPCSDWATTPIMENNPDPLGDIERVKTQ